MTLSLLRGRIVRLLVAAGSCLVLLSACAGGGAGTAVNSPVPAAGTSACAAASGCGGATLTITDAKGDFLSYIVNLTSLQLQTAAGASVETLPASTKIDFAQLVDLTEVVSAGQIPAGDYVSATLKLDYSSASISADDGTGHAVALKPLDINGNPLTGTLSVTVQLDSASHLIITPARTSRLAFDFNLAASNTVDLTAATVRVSPTLLASVVPSDVKPLRVRGALASVDSGKGDFVLNVQPFDDHGATAGQITVQVAPTTTWQINGTAYVGALGTTALAALPAGTMVAAFGSLTTADASSFTATNVLAGTSLENPGADQFSGTVIKRTATTLTLRGATWEHRDGDFDFELADVTVNVGSGTVVTKTGHSGSFTSADISVGQRVNAFGAATKASDGSITLDATAGEVRLAYTFVWGTVTAMSSSGLTLNLQALGGFPASVFDFSGTGTSTANDAKPGAYQVETSSLSQSGLALNGPARLAGFVTPFGTAPPDFVAETLVSFPVMPDALLIGFANGGSTTAFTGLTGTSTSLQLNLAGVGVPHVIDTRSQSLDVTSLAAPPKIVPDTTSSDTVFAIGHRSRENVESFNSFGDFIAALASELNGTSKVVVVAATGQFDSTKDTFMATRLVVGLDN
jgi:hypothetical protein